MEYFGEYVPVYEGKSVSAGVSVSVADPVERFIEFCQMNVPHIRRHEARVLYRRNQRLTDMNRQPYE